MFTEQQLKAAHSKVKTGADFPGYIQEIKSFGLTTYEYWVNNGRITYYGENGHIVNSAPKYQEMAIAKNPSATALRYTIAIHQQGQTDFLTFCNQAAEAGVEKWVIDTKTMLCIYYDIAGNEIVAELIPEAGYNS